MKYIKFYTSDLHLSHNNIIKYENRPFNNVNEMNDYLINKWNNKVKKDDEIYILGDFAFTNGLTTNQLLQRLNGSKYLIRGNHDRFLDDKNFDRSLFKWIRDYATIKDNESVIVMFHYPIAVWDRQHHNSIHLYGHVHSNKDNHHPLISNLVNGYNVGVDVNNFEPKSLEELLKR